MALIVDIEKTLGDFHLKVNFTAEREVMALLGASGCGKSMTLGCIAGIVRPDKGHIELNGRVLFDSEKKIDLPPQKRKVGYLFQQYALFPHMTVEQNIRAGAHARPKNESRRCGRFCTHSAWRDWRTTVRVSFPADSSSGARWRAFWSGSPSLCCSMSRFPRSMRT